MLSGKDPGVLGIYGFRNRADHSYTAYAIANGNAVREPRVWDILSRAGKKVVVLGVPQTYPPRPVNGWLVADFLAPDTSVDYTYPKALKQELEQAIGAYILDVDDFRTDDKDALRARLFALLDNRFAAARYLMAAKPWDFFMMVEMGLDRLHHGFWKYADPAHPKFVRGNPHEDIFRAYYQALDAHVGRLLEGVGEETAVLVVSDHGAKAMLGGVCVNQWLMQERLLSITNEVSGITRLEDCTIDWPRTKAWSSGGYYARVFINAAGREPQGVVPAAQYESFRDDLAARLEAMPGPDGMPLGNRVYKPESIYRKCNGVPPDLLVYFGDLAWRSVGSVGFDSIYTFENDTGPDDANHDYHGIFIMDDRRGGGGRELEPLHLMDVAPTILGLFGLPIPEDMQGRPIG